jgi:hypothetical protein
MLFKCLSLPAIVWLLLPPGICICRLSQPLLLPAAAATADAGTPAPGDDDGDHMPWCTARKMTYAAPEAIDAGNLQPLDALTPLPSRDAESPDMAPAAGRPMTDPLAPSLPIYLAVGILRL